MRTNRRPGPVDVALPRPVTSVQAHVVLPKRSRCALAVHAALVGLSLSAALGSMPTAMAQTTAQGEAAARAYSIGAGNLGDVLAQFAATTGVQLVFDPAALAGRTSPGLQGSYTVQQGFARVLQGTNWQVQAQGGNAYVLQRVETLPEVTVTAPGRSGGMAVLPEVVVTAPYTRGITEGTGSYTTDSSSAATGLNLSLRETPQSVSIITRERMDQQNLTSLGDVLNQTTGVTFTNFGAQLGGNTHITSRGYGIYNLRIDGNAPAPFARIGGQGGNLDTAIYDSVTVVRGATGLMSGAGDPGGSISLVRKRPTQDFQASLEATVGRWNKRRIVTDIGGSLNTSASLRGRVIAAYDESQSWINDFEGDSKIIYGILETDLSPKTTLSLSLEHQRISAKNWSPQTGFPILYADNRLTPYGRHENMSPSSSYRNYKNTDISVKLSHELNNDWQSEISYSNKQKNTDLLRGYFNWWSLTGEDTEITGTLIKQKQDQQTNNLSLKINGRFNVLNLKNEIILGADSLIHKDKIPQDIAASDVGFVDSTAAIYPDTSILPNGTNSPYEIDLDQLGFYAANRIYASDRLSLITGGRWSWWKTLSRDLQPTQVYDDRKERGIFTPYAGIIFDINENISIYGSYTDIFQPQNNQDVTGRYLDPELGKNYEIGAKGEWFNGRLNASVAAFETRKDNLAVRDGENLTPDGNFAYRAENNTKGRGWEMELSGELARGWNFQGGYTRFTNRNSQGDRLNGDAIHSIKLFSSYSPEKAPGLTVGGGLSWQSKWYLPSATTEIEKIYTQKPYAVFNLMTKYDFNKNLSANLTLNNVFNKSYRTSINFHEYGAERNLRATLKYQF